MPLPFNKKLDLKLLELVKQNPMIYNTKHPKFVDFDAREVIWQKIGDTLNKPAGVCKSRWVNIRDMMRRRLRNRFRNPQAKSYHYKYEEEMSFLLPYFKEMSNEYEDYLEEASEIEISADVFGADVFDGNISTEQFDRQDLKSTDALDVFLITVGNTLRKFSPYYLNQAKSKIFQIVQDYELQQIMDKEEQPNTSNDR
ncbi:unnamed protein product [Leptosia nina]|uniref:MADF domain-containing protein n=1 Tax=Leptosia nina TaxID=320188 RepID=A0AAV1JBT5_9NEOP